MVLGIAMTFMTKPRWPMLLCAVTLACAAVAQAESHTVRTTDDSGEGSLRDTLDDADDGDTILFASDVRGEIVLTDPLDVDHAVSIKGPGADVLTINGGELSTVLDVTADATISGLAITGGDRGISLDRDKLTIIDCTVRDSAGDGIDVGSRSRLTVLRSLIAGHREAGIEASGAATCINSTISDNGGNGITSDDGHIVLASCTIADNRGTGLAASGGEARATNSLFAGNAASCSGAVVSQGYNLTDDTSCQFAAAGDQSGVDARLGGLLANGGATDTRAPATGSPAIDSGNPAGCSDPGGTALTVDQRGLRRPSGGRCDIGAVEAQVVVATAARGTVVNRIVALVDGDPITAYELKDFSAGDPRLQQAAEANRGEVLELLVTKRVIEKEVERQGIVIQEAEIDRYVDNIKQRNNIDDMQLEAALGQQGITREKYRAQVRDELQRAQLINREIRGKVSVSPEEIERYAREHGEGGAADDEQVTISHIVLKLPPDATAAQVAEVEARADKIYEELDDGADFAEVAARESEDGAAKSGGKLGTFKRGEMREDLEAAVADLEPGEISKPVKGPTSINIIRLDERIGAGDSELSEAKMTEIKEKLYAEALEERYNRWLKEDLRQRHHVEIKP